MKVKVAIIVSLAVIGCSRAPSANEFVYALPQIAITSPTAKALSKIQNAKLDTDNLLVKGSIGQIVQPITNFFSGTKNALRRSLPQSKVSCFGKGLPYSKHADGGPDSSTRGGETGFQAEIEKTDEGDVACAAAAMNEKVAELGSLVNQALHLTSLSASQLQANGQRLPKKIGDTAAAKIPNSEPFENAQVVVSRINNNLKADKQNALYLWDFVAISKQGEVEKPVHLWLTHARPLSEGAIDASDGAVERGRFWGILPQGTDVYAFSLTYRIEGGRTTYELKSAQSRGLGAFSHSSFFNSEGMVQFEPALSRQNLFYVVADLDSKTGLGKLKASWAGSPTDARAKVFEVDTETSQRGTDEGFAYFGYGAALTEKNIAAHSVGTAESMICAWSAGKRSFLATGKKAEVPNVVQAMKIQRNPSTGLFEPAGQNQHIRYCPTQSCNGALGMRYGNKPCEGRHELARVALYGKVLIEAPSYP